MTRIAGAFRARVHSLPLARGVAAVAALLGAGCNRYWVCDAGDELHAALPRHLSATGLYADSATGELAPGVVAYTPRFPLWSDGSDKQRWIRLPPGQRIDTSDMDDWIFPEGTQLWKEFSVEGVRIETRLLEKRGPRDADWLALSYVWDADDQDATAAPLGVVDSHDTSHDVPAAAECVACHGGRRSFVLGFSAVQLAQPAAKGELDLDGLIQAGQLSQAPDAVPVVPGNAIEVASLGYLHANCSHCHNQSRPERSGARCFNPEDEYDFTLAVDALETTVSTPTYRTMGDAVKRGKPNDSRLLKRVKTRAFLQQMPPLATEQVDEAAVVTLRAWIEGL
jgi:hypothetical protein